MTVPSSSDGHRLRVHGIQTVGLVDKGDDPEALITLWKRKDPPETAPEGSVALAKALGAALGRLSDE